MSRQEEYLADCLEGAATRLWKIIKDEDPNGSHENVAKSVRALRQRRRDCDWFPRGKKNTFTRST